MQALRLATVAILGAAQKDAFDSYDRTTLERMVFVRGLSCNDCTTKQFRQMARENAELPIDEELALEFDEVVSYRKKVEELNITKVDFLHQVTYNRPMDESRAERVWRNFEELLSSGAVHFADNGTFLFSLPVTHELSHDNSSSVRKHIYLPGPVCDMVEECYFASRRVYLRIPRRYRRRIEAGTTEFVESGNVYYVISGLVTILLFDLVRQARSP